MTPMTPAQEASFQEMVGRLRSAGGSGACPLLNTSDTGEHSLLSFAAVLPTTLLYSGHSLHVLLSMLVASEWVLVQRYQTLSMVVPIRRCTNVLRWIPSTNDLRTCCCRYMNDYDRAMMHLDKAFGFVAAPHQYVSKKDEGDKLIVVERGDLVLVFNFHPTQSYTDYQVGCYHPGAHK